MALKEVVFTREAFGLSWPAVVAATIVVVLAIVAVLVDVVAFVTYFVVVVGGVVAAIAVVGAVVGAVGSVVVAEVVLPAIVVVVAGKVVVEGAVLAAVLVLAEAGAEMNIIWYSNPVIALPDAGLGMNMELPTVAFCTVMPYMTFANWPVKFMYWPEEELGIPP